MVRCLQSREDAKLAHKQQPRQGSELAGITFGGQVDSDRCLQRMPLLDTEDSLNTFGGHVISDLCLQRKPRQEFETLRTQPTEVNSSSIGASRVEKCELSDLGTNTGAPIHVEPRLKGERQEKSAHLGGCDARAMSDQGRRDTSGRKPVTAGEQPTQKSHSFEVHGSATADNASSEHTVRTAKRVVLLLHVSLHSP